MPETARVNARDPTRPDRVSLNDALAALDEAKFQLQQLESGADKAREKRWDLTTKAEEAQEHLAQLQRDEKRRLASAWAADDKVDASPIPGVEHALAQARQALEDINKVEAALAQEIPAAQHWLNDVQRGFYAALAEVVCSSPAYDNLRQAHTDAWRHLRTIRECLKVTHAAFRGQVSQALLDAGHLSEPTFRALGFPVNELEVKAWAEALAALEKDPDVPLPST